MGPQREKPLQEQEPAKKSSQQANEEVNNKEREKKKREEKRNGIRGNYRRVSVRTTSRWFNLNLIRWTGSKCKWRSKNEQECTWTMGEEKFESSLWRAGRRSMQWGCNRAGTGWQHGTAAPDGRAEGTPGGSLQPCWHLQPQAALLTYRKVVAFPPI